MDFLTLSNVVSVALISSFSHCLGMCGGFVIAYNSKIKNLRPAQAMIYGFVYHICRVLAYCVLGAAFAFFGSKVILSISQKGFVYFFVGIFLFIFGLAIWKRGFLLSVIENKKISNLIMPLFAIFSKKQGLFAFGILGFLNGLLPCGVVYYFLALSFSAANLKLGILIMLIFGICTLPAMLFLGYASNLINAKFSKFATLLSCIFMCGYGIYLSFLGFLAI